MNTPLRESFKKLFMYSAMFHVGVLVIKAVIERSLQPLNYFDMLDFEYFIPGLETGITNHILSGIFAAIIFFAIYLREKRNKKSLHQSEE